MIRCIWNWLSIEIKPCHLSAIHRILQLTLVDIFLVYNVRSSHGGLEFGVHFSSPFCIKKKYIKSTVVAAWFGMNYRISMHIRSPFLPHWKSNYRNSLQFYNFFATAESGKLQHMREFSIINQSLFLILMVSIKLVLKLLARLLSLIS